jgi:hypothetical protein
MAAKKVKADKVSKAVKKVVEAEVKPVVEKKILTTSEQIWEEIKNLPLDLYSLPNQRVEMHVIPILIPGNTLIVTLKVSGVLPVLESTLASRLTGGKKYKLELADGGRVLISRA